MFNALYHRFLNLELKMPHLYSLGRRGDRVKDGGGPMPYLAVFFNLKGEVNQFPYLDVFINLKRVIGSRGMFDSRQVFEISALDVCCVS